MPDVEHEVAGRKRRPHRGSRDHAQTNGQPDGKADQKASHQKRKVSAEFQHEAKGTHPRRFLDEPAAVWTDLAVHYDRLFPPGRAQLDFVATIFARSLLPVRRLLDVGCAAGGYSFRLAEAGFEVTGVDLDPRMIRAARAKVTPWRRAAGDWSAGSGAAGAAAVGSAGAAGRGPAPRFLVRNMTDLRGLPEAGRRPFDGVICLGNTLAHALSAAELGTALGEMARVLRVGGTAIFQTVNYDRLAATGELPLPPLRVKNPAGEDGELVFRRLCLPRADGLVNFVTTLYEGSRTLFRAETLQRPILREELETVARMALHGEVKVWGDFLFSAWSEVSPATIVVATRGER